MAEALLGVVFENLLSLVQNEFATISGIKSKAEKLSTTLDLIQAVLEDAETKQVTNRSIKVWLHQLKDAVYVLDDILDECSIKSSRLGRISSFKPKNIMFRHKIGNKLKEITNRFDQIAESKNKFLLREGVTVTEREHEVAEWRQTSSIIAESKVIGREYDKEKIVEFLLTQAKDSDFVSVYPIVGIGGVGKTTLAQLVYNDDKVSGNFVIKIWICVSENFLVKRILCSIIESITKEKCDAFDLDVLQRKVQELLQGKRYLLVLDDVWNKSQELEWGLSQEKWNKLKYVLSCGSKGSSLLVSTRDTVVASIMGTCQTHPLFGLSDNECWLLFKQYAFGPDKEECSELVAIGKEIVKKCGGLPLAAQALGGLMYSRSEEKEWLEIKDSEIWTLSDDSILPALRLSYLHLTPTAKQCFAFCAIFPKDTKIMKETLIHLWMANGFISSRENLQVEDVGSMIWSELCQKSFFQDITIDDYSGDIFFKMHDLVHDLSQSIMEKECMYFEDANMSSLSKRTHHVSFSSENLSSVNKGAFKKVESLRTLFQFFGVKRHFHMKHDIFPTNCSLRVLCTTSFPESSLGSLIHLRYLELHSIHISTLPDSIYSLQKLEILKLKYLTNLWWLPKDLVCLKNLRHLVIENYFSLTQLFPYIGKLSCLRTLSLYIVGLERGQSLTELHDLNLRGKLHIKGLKNVGSLSHAQDANLMGKKDLHELCMSWSVNDEITETPIKNAEQVLEGLQPHTNLKSLKLHYYNGLCFPSWIKTLSSLVALELWFCKNCVQLSQLGKLPSLKKLKLSYMDDVKYMDDEESHNGMEVMVFQSLEKLCLKNLPNFERFVKVERGERFPCLTSLKVSYCPKLELPCLPFLKHLSVFGCDNQFLMSISRLYGLTTLRVVTSTKITSFPLGMLKNLTFLQTLEITNCANLKEIAYEPFNLNLEHLCIFHCNQLESLPEKIWEGLQSLRTMKIGYCNRLRCLPEGIRHLTSLEVLKILCCSTLEERCKKGTGEDWDKIAHIPKLDIS